MVSKEKQINRKTDWVAEKTCLVPLIVIDLELKNTNIYSV